jgi:hypothetical protein
MVERDGEPRVLLPQREARTMYDEIQLDVIQMISAYFKKPQIENRLAVTEASPGI